MEQGILHNACIFEVDRNWMSAAKRQGCAAVSFNANDVPKDVAGLSPFHDGSSESWPTLCNAKINGNRMGLILTLVVVVLVNTVTKRLERPV